MWKNHHTAKIVKSSIKWNDLENNRKRKMMCRTLLCSLSCQKTLIMRRLKSQWRHSCKRILLTRRVTSIWWWWWSMRATNNLEICKFLSSTMKEFENISRYANDRRDVSSLFQVMLSFADQNSIKHWSFVYNQSSLMIHHYLQISIRIW